MSDRVELTDDERRQLWQGWQTPSIGYTTTIRAVESIVAARVAALTAERDELQGKNGVSEWMYNRTLAERDAARAELAAARHQRDEQVQNHEILIAELAAANARCAELETGIAKLRDGIRGNWPASPTPVEVYWALAALTPEGTE